MTKPAKITSPATASHKIFPSAKTPMTKHEAKHNLLFQQLWRFLTSDKENQYQ